MDNAHVTEAAVRLLKPLAGDRAEIGLILGSGLGDYAERLENPRYLDYAEIEGFPVSTVAGHAGRFVIGECFGKTVIAMQGRFHYYEGHDMSTLTLGVRVMKRLGVEKLLLTNAAGGINLAFKPGDLMLVSDHINFSGSNPLIGKNDDTFGTRFPDASNVYDRELRQKTLIEAERLGIALKTGVYMMFTGPSFETPAEIRFARIIGADAAGMSTVPEALTAAHCGIKTLGISLITNMAAGVLDQPLTHQEVCETAAIASKRFTKLIDGIIENVF